MTEYGNRLSKPLHPRRIRVRGKGSPMTVCIAAMADDGRRLVCASDTMVSTAIASADSAVSKWAAFRGWSFLLSGTLSPADLLYDAAKLEMANAEDNEPATVRGCLERAQTKELERWTAGRWLSKYGLDWDKYRREAPSRFTDEFRNELSRKMMNDGESNYDPDLIVCGWGNGLQQADSGLPYIFNVNHDGVGLHKTEGMYATGSGADAALASLYFHGYRRSMTLAQVVYYVLAARFTAEMAVGVGEKTTFLWVAQRESLESGGYLVETPHIQKIRASWVKFGAPRMPKNAEKMIVEMLMPREKKMSVTLDHVVSTLRKQGVPARPSTSRKSKGRQ